MQDIFDNISNRDIFDRISLTKESEPASFGKIFLRDLQKRLTTPEGYTSIAKGAISAVGAPFAGIDLGLRSIGAEGVANAFAYPFEKIAEGTRYTENLIGKGLDVLGIPRNPFPGSEKIGREISEINQGLAQFLVPMAAHTAFAPKPLLAHEALAKQSFERMRKLDLFDKIEPEPPKDVLQRVDLTEASKGLPLAQTEKPISPIGERPQIVKPPPEAVGKPTFEEFLDQKAKAYGKLVEKGAAFERMQQRNPEVVAAYREEYNKLYGQPVETVGRQAWEMGIDEFTKTFGQETHLGEWAEKYGKGLISEQQYHEARRLWPLPAEDIYTNIVATPREYRGSGGDLHRAIVWNAAKEGKIGRGIQDYPDLAKKYVKPPAETGTIRVAEQSPLRKRYNELLAERLRGTGFENDPQSPVYRNASQDAFTKLKKETGRKDLNFFDLDKPPAETVGKPAEVKPTKTPLEEGRTKKILGKKITYEPYGTVTRQQFIDRKLEEGGRVETREVPNEARQKQLEREQDYLRETAPLGNPNHPETKRLRAVVEELKSKPTKTEYVVVSPDGKVVDITKTEYDYALTVVPSSKQIEGTMFEKPKPEEPTLFGGFPRLNLRTGLSEKAFEATKKVPVGRKIIEFFSPLSTVPESQQLKTARYKALGDISKVERIVDNLSGRLKKLPEDVKEQMFRVLDGQMPVETLPTEYQGTARLMRNLSDLAGRMLVKRGIISEETFNTHKGKYIHYMYLRHVLGDDIPIGTGGGRLDLSIAKQRKDLTTEQRKALGLIENVSVAIPVGMSKALGDVAKYDYFKTISENPEWTWKPSIIKVGNERFGIGQLADEVATYKTITERFPNNRDVATRYNTLKDALEVTSKEIGKIPKDYEQLPNLKSYGPLRGVVVRKEIAKDIKPMFSIRDNDIGHAARVMVDASAKSVAVFKLGKVPFNLPTVVRNVVSNVIQLNMSGIPLAEVPIWYVKALKQMAEKSPAYQRAFRNGIFKTNWSVQEIGEVLGEFQKIKSGAPHEFVLTAQKLARYYGKIDDVTKFAKFLERTENGVSISDAVIEAQKWGMDYSLVSRSVKFFRRHLMPFASYSYKIVPLLAETALERPHILAKYVLLPSLITKYAIDRFNISDDEWEKLKKDLPLFIRENKTYTALPWKDERGNLKWVDIQYFFPWGNLEAAGQSAARGKVGETAQQLGIGSNPLLLVANTFVRKGNPKDPFTGKEIYNDLDTGNEKMAKTLEYLYNLYAPSMLTRYGALGQTLNIGEPQKYGRMTETPDALLRFLGVNIVTPTKEQARANLKAKQAELRSNLYQHLRDPKLTKEERQKYVQKYREEVLRLR